MFDLMPWRRRMGKDLIGFKSEMNNLVNSQFTLLRHREVSQMFIDGMLGKNFPKPLSFYLSRHEEYLEAVKKMVLKPETTDGR